MLSSKSIQHVHHPIKKKSFVFEYLFFLLQNYNINATYK